MNNNQSTLIADVTSYVIGVSLGLFLIVAAAWADMESTFYGFSRLASAGLGGFSCPVLMTRTETSTISLRVSNTTDQVISPAIRTEVSTPLLPEQSLESIQLAPGESRRLEWTVGPQNIDIGRFIFAKALIYSAHPLPSREATCGIFIVDLPGSGRVILPILVAISLLGMGWGLRGMNRSAGSNAWVGSHVRLLTFMALMIVLGLVVSFMGSWVISLVILAVNVLLIVILVGSQFMSEHRK